jgi:mannose-6-phosphate isomerase-like protein (cupin superfamily)
MIRVVTGVNEEGKSYVMSSDEIEEGIVWAFKPEQVRHWIAAIDPNDAAVQFELGMVAGDATWSQAKIEPGTAVKGLPGVDEQGFHTTRTVDFVYVLEGQLTMFLDEGSVELRKGDFVVQQATRHAWENKSDKPTSILVLQHKPSIATS